jgi:hypothetical protein
VDRIDTEGGAMRKTLLVGLSALVLAAAGCGGEEAQPNVVEVRGDEYAYVMADRVRGGVVTMEFTNTGDELHEYALARLADGKTVEDLMPLLDDPSQQGPPPWIEDIGGVPTLSPGETVGITRELKPGAYVVLCFVPAPDGRPHIAHGMVRAFDVVGRSEAELPEPDAVIEATDARFEIPALEPGRQTIELRNSARKPREFYLLAPRPGTTLAAIERWGEGGFRGQPLATFLGAMQSIPPGTSVFLTVELEAGKRYLLFDEDLRETAFTVKT